MICSNSVTDYEIPYLLYNDSNYHVVSGLYDYPMQQLTYVENDPSPTVISSSNQSVFWNIVVLDAGKGSYIGAPVLSDDLSTDKVNGTNSMKIEVGTGITADGKLLILTLLFRTGPHMTT